MERKDPLYMRSNIFDFIFDRIYIELYSIGDSVLMQWAQTASQVGDIIATARRYRGLTQVELARQLGVTQSWLSQIEKGKDNAQLGKVLRVLSYLGVRLQVGESPWQEGTLPSQQTDPNIQQVLARLSAKPTIRRRKGGK
jgi:y4mF family transcriptional regulator